MSRKHDPANSPELLRGVSMFGDSDSKNGINKALYLNSVLIQFESKPRQIERGRGRIFDLKQAPSGFGSQIELVGFVVAVTEATQTAEQIRQINEATHFDVRII